MTKSQVPDKSGNYKNLEVRNFRDSQDKSESKAKEKLNSLYIGKEVYMIIRCRMVR
jgi:hypothetical protein